MIGRTLAQYRIVASLGAGGMGEVYRANDLKLQRDVALKVLPAGALADEAARRRFRREMLTLSRLSHPHIAALFDADSIDGTDFLVMELVPGATLEDELLKGPFSERDVVALGAQLARGLMAAHAAGVVHRDLKPSNLALTADGLLKVLDFGIAHLDPVDRGEKVQTATGTRPGAVLGSLPYMSPEQLLGKRVDARADVYSTGAVLYELATGKLPFGRKRGVELQDAILHDAPPPPRDARPALSPGLQALILKALDKNPELRYQTARELLVDLERLQAGVKGVGKPTAFAWAKHSRWGPRVALMAIGLCALVLGSWSLGLLPARITRGLVNPPSPKPVRFLIDIEQEGVTSALNAGPQGVLEGQLALCPDGTCLVYRGALDGVGRLFLRSLDRLSATPLPGTERAHGPFFSPDGRWLYFFADGRLRKTLVDKPMVKDVASAPSGGSGSFGPDGRIYFAADAAGPISRVSENGLVEIVTDLDKGRGERGHRWPLLLDGQTLIYEARMASRQARIVARSLTDGSRTTLVEKGFHPRLAGSHLVFYDGAVLKAAPLDVRLLKVTGPSVDAVETIPSDPAPTFRYDVSATGTLAWFANYRNRRPEARLFRVGRSGQAQPLTDVRRAFGYPRFSPDGRRLAVTVWEEGGSGIWILDVARQALTRLTLSERSEAGIWTPDGREVTYRSRREGAWNLFSQPVDGSGPVERLTTSTADQCPASFSPDGRTLAFIEDDPPTSPDIWTLSRRDLTTRPLVDSPYGEWDGMLSPDGRLVAYASMESGRLEVYVRPYGGPGVRQQVSAEGGNSPVWSRDGRELFYLNGPKMMAAPLQSLNTWGRPLLLFEGEYEFVGNVANYDVTPEGHAFVMVKGEGAGAPLVQGHVLTSWLDDLERRSPASH